MDVDLFKFPEQDDGSDWHRREIAHAVMRLDAAVFYHMNHFDASEPLPGYQRFFQCSSKAVIDRNEVLDGWLDSLSVIALFRDTDLWITALKERILSLRTQIILLTASGQL